MIKQTRKFVVLVGSHEQNGRIYRKGDIVSSQHDLDAQFVNKFREMDAGTPISGGAVLNDGTRPNPLDAPGATTLANGSAGTNPATTPNTANADVTTPAKGTEAGDDDEKDGDRTATATAQGVDVTEKFPKAKEQAFKVFKAQGQYHVYDEDDLDKPLVSGLKKAAVGPAIEELLKK